MLYLIFASMTNIQYDIGYNIVVCKRGDVLFTLCTSNTCWTVLFGGRPCAMTARSSKCTIEQKVPNLDLMVSSCNPVPPGTCGNLAPICTTDGISNSCFSLTSLCLSGVSSFLASKFPCMLYPFLLVNMKRVLNLDKVLGKSYRLFSCLNLFEPIIGLPSEIER